MYNWKIYLLIAVCILSIITSWNTYALPTPDFVVSIGGVALYIIGLLTTVFFIFRQIIIWFIKRSQSHYLLLGTIGITGLIIWVMIHVIWQYRYVTGFHKTRDYSQSQNVLDQIAWVNSSWAQIDSYAIPTNEFIALQMNSSWLQVIDIREDAEYDLWHIPGTMHIRFADIKFGTGRDNIEISKPIYFLCSNSMRGRAITAYMRTQWYEAYYLIEWLDWYVSQWWKRVWNNDFYSAYASLFLEWDLRKWSLRKYEKSVHIIDSRIASYLAWENVLSISLLTDTTDKVESTINQARYSWFIVVYDDYVTWLQSIYITILLENRWFTSLGKYYMLR